MLVFDDLTDDNGHWSVFVGIAIALLGTIGTPAKVCFAFAAKKKVHLLALRDRFDFVTEGREVRIDKCFARSHHVQLCAERRDFEKRN